MKYIKFLLVGIFFGIVLVKSEAVSWYRIYEMFQFQSFHMYGLMGTAVVSGVLFLWLFKSKKVKNTEGRVIEIPSKEKGITRYIVGGIIFGLGWALAGACPGPMFILAGAGFTSILIVLASAVLGTFIYGIIKDKLPH